MSGKYIHTDRQTDRQTDNVYIHTYAHIHTCIYTTYTHLTYVLHYYSVGSGSSASATDNGFCSGGFSVTIAVRVYLMHVCTYIILEDRDHR